MTTTTLLNIFYNDLNSLKLDQFPCGTGSWRQDKLPGYEQDGDVNHETLQSLEELSRSEIFQVHTSWSDDIKDLRELSVKNPGIITESFIFKHFKTLRLIDRNGLSPVTRPVAMVTKAVAMVTKTVAMATKAGDPSWLPSASTLAASQLESLVSRLVVRRRPLRMDGRTLLVNYRIC
eukprot:sb/3471840/